MPVESARSLQKAGEARGKKKRAGAFLSLLNCISPKIGQIKIASAEGNATLIHSGGGQMSLGLIGDMKGEQKGGRTLQLREQR